MAIAHQTLLDRQSRVRMALWAYASITIDKLQPWTNFWSSLPSELEVYSMENLPSLFHKSLKSFEEGLHNLTEASLKRLEDSSNPFSFSFVERAQIRHVPMKLMRQVKRPHHKLRDFFRPSVIDSERIEFCLFCLVF
jgi:hypothetical protein